MIAADIVVNTIESTMACQGLHGRVLFHMYCRSVKHLKFATVSDLEDIGLLKGHACIISRAWKSLINKEVHYFIDCWYHRLSIVLFLISYLLLYELYGEHTEHILPYNRACWSMWQVAIRVFDTKIRLVTIRFVSHAALPAQKTVHRDGDLWKFKVHVHETVACHAWT